MSIDRIDRINRWTEHPTETARSTGTSKTPEAYRSTRSGQSASTSRAGYVLTASTTFRVMQSLRLDKGYGSQVHP
jgi:hypothetical protein